MSASRIVLIVLCSLAFAACGQSGPLYLPGDPSDIQEAPPPVPPPETDDDEDDAAP